MTKKEILFVIHNPYTSRNNTKEITESEYYGIYCYQEGCIFEKGTRLPLFKIFGGYSNFNKIIVYKDK